MATEPRVDSLTEELSRYVVGIDLGTTNSAVAYVDTSKDKWQVQTFSAPQLVAAGVVEARETLPSFHYQQAEGEFPAASLALPWSHEPADYCVGVFARDRGAIVPGRLVASAKSWLCHSGVDRLADLLPWHGAPDVDRLSPVEVSARYLAHIRDAWNHRFPGDRLEDQQVVLTLPASFDEVARELTVKAAARAQLPRVVLIEEPQAAIYQWIHAHEQHWQQLVVPGQKILICDVGGGTSDFTLIRVGLDSQGQTQFHRVAVGEHLILGGDNLDLALAHYVEKKLVGDGKLEPRQWAVLVQTARQAKETLLGEHAPERLTLSLPGTGSRLIGGAVQVELTRDEVREQLVDGFFPHVALGDRPLERRSGFQEFGLPYAPDAAITRYLAAFLTAHRHVGLDRDNLPQVDHDLARPDVVLFNGGVFDAPILRERLLTVIADWFAPKSESWHPQILLNDRRDLAVARGAAYYGMVRRGLGVRIAAGLARSYFVGVVADDGTESAICLVPAGVEEGQAVELPNRQFDLLIRQPVEFPLYVSSTQLTVRAGELVPIDLERMTALPPIRTVLHAGRKTAAAASITVHLHARLTEIGTLELWCAEVTGPQTWRLQFDVRAATQTDLVGHSGLGEQAGFVGQEILDECRALIQETFGSAAGSDRGKPEQLVKRLAEIIQAQRGAWPPSLLRELWEALIEVEPGRKKSPVHEARWISLLGFALRPGYGMAVDDWRVAQTRRLLAGLIHNNATVRAEWWILWRRIAGGLPAGQQRALAEPLIADLRALQRALAKGRAAEFKPGSHEAAELWRLLGSLELLSIPGKTELGNIVTELLPREKISAVRGAAVWALGRLGARVPLYGPLNTVVPPEVATTWAERLMRLKHESDITPLALMLLARNTHDRHRDLPDTARREILAWLRAGSAPPHFVQLVAEGGELESAEAGLIFGETLPQGLRIRT